MRRRLILLFVGIFAAAALWFLRGNIRLAFFQPTVGDIAYGKSSSSQRLDYYAPTAGSGPRPAVVFIHGGAFRFGDKREPFASFVDRVKRVNAAGIGFVSVNYRMSGEAGFPAAVRDVRSAVRWLRANAARLNIDPDRIAIWGQSAGANLALMEGLADKVGNFDDPAIAPGVSSRVAAIVAMYAPTDFLQMDYQLRTGSCGPSAAVHDAEDSPESRYIGAAIQSDPDRAAKASPVGYATRGAPPVLLQAGTADCTVPYQQTLSMEQALRAAGARSNVNLFAGAEHGDDAFETEANHRLVIRFLHNAFAAQ